jgi:FkbM family methyltransferase
MIVQRKGWYVPEHDNVCLDFVLEQLYGFGEMFKYCKQARTVIQAGGNLGIWPAEMAKHFQKVYTVEPDKRNFEALKMNIGHIPNIDYKNCAFGKEFGQGSIDDIIPGNIGAYQVKAGADFDIITIDSLNITDCDLLQLDVEGFEQFAIEGAINTIKDSWPVISLELKGLGTKYGCPDYVSKEFLQNLGYKIVKTVGCDIIFVKE